jgi:molecular chaperone GrpE (heat shock protein)
VIDSVLPGVSQPDPREDLQALQREWRSLVGGLCDVLESIDAWLPDTDGEEQRRLDLLRRQALSVLIRHGVRPTARAGEPLDLAYHEVVEAEPSEATDEVQIVRVVKQGYEQMARPPVVLRYAQVVVSASADDPQPPGPRDPAPRGTNHE